MIKALFLFMNFTPSFDMQVISNTMKQLTHIFGI
ncbi:hypothetical protein AERO9A_340133 [Aeromonas salmonicida]|nr:hypothetical protein AERO9A_340133 [Aeromonas salmonicida]